MDVKDFYYDLPQELIAQDPLEDRSSSRLMVLDKITGEVEHRHFKDITEYLRPGDCLVINPGTSLWREGRYRGQNRNPSLKKKRK